MFLLQIYASLQIFFIVIKFTSAQNSNLISENNNTRPHYVVLMVEDIPFLRVHANGTYEGYCIDLMDYIAKALNFTYEIRIPEDRTYGIYQNGSWNGVMKEFLDGKGDIIGGSFTVMSERAKFIDYTVPFYGFVGMTILVKKRAPPNDIFSFVRVFDWKVWLVAFIVIIFVGFMIYILEKFSPFSSINTTNELKKESEARHNFRESMWLSFGTITLSGAEFPPITVSTLVLLGGFWMFCSIFINTYQANLSAFLTISRLESSVSSLKDLGNKKKFKFSFVRGTSVQTYFEEMKLIEDNFYDFWKQSSLLNYISSQNCDERQKNHYTSCQRMRIKSDTRLSRFGSLEYKPLWEYPLSRTYTKLLEKVKRVGYLNSTQEGINLVLKSSPEQPFALVLEYPIAQFEVNRNCELKMVGEQFSSRPYAIGVRKGSELQDTFSEVILGLQRDLILDALKAKWIGRINIQCSASGDIDTKITLNTIGGAFIAMASAAAIGILLFLIALINRKFKSAPKLSENRKRKINEKVIDGDLVKNENSNLRFRQINGENNATFQADT